MGLDISYYSNAEKVEEQPERDENGWFPDEWYDHGYIHAFTLEGMDRSIRGLEPETWYDADYEGGFRAGSYGGYNQWRNMLSKLALGVEAIEVWDDHESYEDKPFYELIQFADNEGTIGPEAAADLYVDFCTEQEKVMANLEAATDIDQDWAEYFVEKYLDWKEACRVAGTEHGLIQFH